MFKSRHFAELSSARSSVSFPVHFTVPSVDEEIIRPKTAAKCPRLDFGGETRVWQAPCSFRTTSAVAKVSPGLALRLWQCRGTKRRKIGNKPVLPPAHLTNGRTRPLAEPSAPTYSCAGPREVSSSVTVSKSRRSPAKKSSSWSPWKNRRSASQKKLGKNIKWSACLSSVVSSQV
jgi:hypothetical protein